MGKRVVKVLDLPSSGGTAVLLILSTAFFVGSLAGCVLVNRVGGSGSIALGEYLEGYLSVAYSGDLAQPAILPLLWETIRWPLFVFILSVTPLGLLGIPVLFLVRGFLLSFSIASFFRVLGTVGLALAFVVFGLTGLLCIPVFFILGVQGFLLAGTMTGRLIGEGRRLPLFDRITLLRCGMCATVLCVCSLIEYHIIPILLGSLAAFILG